MRHNEVEHSGVTCLRLLMFETHEAKSCECHDFPGHEEQPNVVSYEDQGCSQQQCVEKCAQQTDVLSAEEAFGLIATSDPDRMQIVQSGLEKKDLLAAA